MQNGAKYKDGLFRDYFSEPKRLLLLVNALLNLNIRDEKEIKINSRGDKIRHSQRYNVKLFKSKTIGGVQYGRFGVGRKRS
jgi:hypothetical protein